MKKTRIKIRLENSFKYNYVLYTIKEQFVASGVRWVRCEDQRDDNKYFTELEVIKILKSNDSL